MERSTGVVSDGDSDGPSGEENAGGGETLNRPRVALPPRAGKGSPGVRGGRVPSSGGLASSLVNVAFPAPSHRAKAAGGAPTSLGCV